MSRKISSVIFISGVAAIILCALFFRGYFAWSLIGDYTSVNREHSDDGEFKCDATMTTDQSLNLFSMKSTTKLELKFQFDGKMQFKTQVLHYYVTLDGDWTTSGDTLVISPNKDSFSMTYVSSEASSAIENAMVRHLKHYVSDNIERSIRKKLIEHNKIKMKVEMVNQDGIFGSDNGTTRSLKRK